MTLTTGEPPTMSALHVRSPNWSREQIWLVRVSVQGPCHIRAPAPDLVRKVNLIAGYMARGKMKQVYLNDDLQQLLRTRCIICGQAAYRLSELLAHQRQCHASYLAAEGLEDTYQHMVNDIQILPCKWCSCWHHEHECQPLWQSILSVQLLRTDLDPGPRTMATTSPSREAPLECVVAAKHTTADGC